MISKCSRLLLATQRNALSIFCKHASSASTSIRFDDKKVLVTGAGKGFHGRLLCLVICAWRMLAQGGKWNWLLLVYEFQRHGIGRTLALKLADAGANVVAISRTRSDLESLKSENPNKIQTLCLDIRKWHDTKSAIMDLGPVDLLVNAGITDAKELGRITKKEVKRVFNMNVEAITNIARLIADEMKGKGQGGSIVNISSVIGKRPASYSSVYGASKMAVNQLTRSMAVEYKPYKIRVNSVNPTIVRIMYAERTRIFDNSNKWANAPRLRITSQIFSQKTLLFQCSSF